MLRQPLQRLGGMQASDIDIYRKITREKTATMVRQGGRGRWRTRGEVGSGIGQGALAEVGRGRGWA